MQMIYAHRGASGYAPENTLRAFEMACDMGADGVELDVQLTRDRQLVVFHDETIDRVTDGSGAVADYTYAELRRFPVTRAVNGTDKDTIPLLKDVLTLLKEHGLQVNIELKNSHNPYHGMEAKCIQEVADTGMTEHTLYSSFNHNSLMLVKRLLPEAKCGMLYSCCMIQPWRYAVAYGMDALHPHYSELAEEKEIPEAHALRLEVNPWTVNREEDLRRVIAQGADRIITNYPDLGRRLLEERRGTEK